MSQEHLELSFSSIRSKGGFNNNPSAKQFIAIFKCLLVHHKLTHLNSNCADDITTPILNVNSKRLRTTQENYYGFCSNEEIDCRDISFSPYIDNIIEYIAGFVVRKVANRMSYAICKTALYGEENSVESLISYKNRGGLKYPSKTIFSISKTAEKICKEILNSPPKFNNLMPYLINKLLNNMD
jgi:hypothetical protein